MACSVERWNGLDLVLVVVYGIRVDVFEVWGMLNAPLWKGIIACVQAGFGY